MISLRKSKDFCKDYTKIENYETAVNDTKHTWHCHHRLETHFSDGTPRPKNAQLLASELKALDMYYDRPPEELIYLSAFNHRSLHSKEKKHSEETKCKISNSHKGIKRGPLSEETKRKLSESKKGRCFRPRTYYKCIETNEIDFLRSWVAKGYYPNLVASGQWKQSKGLHFVKFQVNEM